MKFLLRPTFAALLACLSSTARAHEVWIEDTPEGELVVRFAEYGDDYEKSPGALDGLSIASAFTAGAEGKPMSFETQKKADHFLLLKASPKAAAQAECGYSVMGKPGDPEKPARRPIFYARWHTPGVAAAATALTFDIVPTANAGEVRVHFRGQPVPQAKVFAHLPDGSEKEIVADENGLARIDASKPGLYMLNCKYQRESTPGFSGGKPYDVVSHNCSLAWRQP